MDQAAAITLKVSHLDTVRRFRMPTSTSWANLQAHLVTIFSLSLNPTFVALTYLDEDGDAVQLNSDEELQDVIEQAVADKKKLIKFTLVEMEELDKDYTMVGKVPTVEQELEQKAVEQGEEPVVKEQMVQKVEEPVVVHPEVVPEELAPSLEESTPPPDYASFTSEFKGKGPEVTMATELEGLIRDFMGIMIQHPEFIQRATSFKDRILNGSNIDIDIVTKFFEKGTSQDKPTEQHKEVKVEYNWDDPSNVGPSMLMRGCESKANCGPSMARRGCFFQQHAGPSMLMRGQTEPNEPRRHGCAGRRHCRKRRSCSPNVVPEHDPMAEKLALLKEMGFTDEALNKETLYGCKGDLSAAIDALAIDSSDDYYM